MAHCFITPQPNQMPLANSLFLSSTSMEDLARIESLTEGTYRTWSTRMQLFLKAQRLWPVVVEKRSVRGTATGDLWSRKNSDALSLIVLRVDDSQLSLLRNIDTAYEAWRVLRDAHVNRSHDHRQTLLRQLAYRKCGLLSNLDAYLEEFQDTVWQLEEIEVEVPEGLLVAMLLNGLPRSFTYFSTLVESRDEEEPPSLTGVIAEVRAERDRQVNSTELRSVRRERSSGRCKKCGRSGHLTRQCRRFVYGRYAM